MSRRFLSSMMNEASTSSSPLVQKATQPTQFTSSQQLSKYLRKHVLAHAPGRFVVVPKPYGISCVGHAQEDGGVFGTGIKDEKKLEKWTEKLKENSQKRNEPDSVTISDCIQQLRVLLREPQLSFCTGLKRYLSGAIVLPCNEKDANILKSSIRQMSSDLEPPFMYSALAITVGRPEKRKGQISGFATFRNVGKHKEYIFEERKVKKRAKSGKYAVEGNMSYQVIDSCNGFSLVEFSVNKFARHLPRLMLTQMASPILGDTIYWRRLANIDDRRELIEAGEQGHKIYVPPRLGQILGVEKSRTLLRDLPIYCHVYRTVFDSVGGHEEHGLVAASKPPEHFMSMLELLGLSAGYRDFQKESRKMDEDDGQLPPRRNSGELKF